ncbi:MAG: response regulator transcription factor [Filimonas sp.]|nr:response regulator transcription factor [Filimonas sp.]
MDIAFIDDHKILTDSIKNFLSLDEAIQEVRTFDDGKVFLASLNDFWVPDIVITDLLLPGFTGMEMMQELAQKPLKKSPRVIILSSITDVQTIKQAIRLGAAGYLSKGTAIAELQEALHAVYAGEQYISQKLRNSLVNSVFTEEQIVYHLSPREKDVLTLICSGCTVKEAAYKLNLSVHTVQSYHKNIMKKFKVNRTADLIVFSIQKGLYNPVPNERI